jgi:pyruvate/2-oxoglutarate dehydrogenase complex dihydrolipoamide acyltransferase (E2) component
MTRLRARVAERLKGAQNTYAMLTTFNEIDMTNIMQLRKDFKVVLAHVTSHLLYLARDGKCTSQDLTHVQVYLVYQLDTGQSDTC